MRQSFALFLGLVSSSSAFAQNPAAITLTKVAEFNSEAGPIVPSLVVSVGRFASGTFVASYEFNVAPQIVHFDAQGRLLKFFEKEGQGPGELSDFPVIAMRHDTLYAFEKNRVVRFDNRLNHIDTRAVPVSVARRASLLGNGGIVIDHPDPRNSKSSILDARLRITRTDSTPEPRARANLFAPSGYAAFWRTSGNGQQLVKAAANGSTMATFRVNRPWLQQFDTTARFRPAVADIAEMQSDRLLILTRTPEADIEQDSVTRLLSAGGAFRPAEVDGGKTWDTMLEVINPVAGLVLAALKDERALRLVAGTADLVFSTRAVADGHVLIEIWRVNIPR